jgi:hypothetical protein
MFSRKVKIYVLLLLVLLALVPWWILREPSYGGHSLSEWLAVVNSEQGTRLDQRQEAEAAIRAIGPRAVPFLLPMLSARETRIGEIYRFVRKKWLRPREAFPAPWDVQSRGFEGLWILGPAAKKGVPQLVRLLEQEPERTELWGLLEKIGPESAPAASLLKRSFPGLEDRPSKDPWASADFHPAWLASDLMVSWGGSYREVVAEQLVGKTNSLIKRVSALWALRKDPEFARGLMPSMARIIADESESPLLKTACLHALGRIPEPNRAVLEDCLRKYEAQFGQLPVACVSNGDFLLSEWSGTNAPPSDPRPPSVLFTNWLTWRGMIGRNLALAPGKGLKIELGPRNPGGAISQVFRTTPGISYRLSFEVDRGRNALIHVAAGDLDTTYISTTSNPANPSRAQFEFRACSPVTTVTFSAPEYRNHGPFIDHVAVEPKQK